MHGSHSTVAHLTFLALFMSGCAFGDPIEGPPGEQSYLSNDNFERGYLMHNVELTDSYALSETEVQEFLDNTPYGGRSVLAGHTSDGISAAQAIVNAAQTYDINPLVMLTRLQVEQSLIGKESASQSKLDKAAGCGCPDNQSCNPAYSGFNKQVDCMASRFRSYLDDLRDNGSTIAGWAVNQSKTTLDGHKVIPKNAATASLYTYTPWVSSQKLHHSIWQKYVDHVGYDASQAPPDDGGGGDNGSGGSGSGGSGSGGSGGSNSSTDVCFPGEKMDNSVCLPTVAHSSSWGSAYAYPSHSSPSYMAPMRFIDLQAVDQTQKLAPNFRLDELMQEWKGRHALYQPHMVEKLQTIRNQTGPLTINSGYRSVGYNASVGGATYSRHMWGDAADMAGSVSLNTLKSKCQALGADYIGMYSSHVHCDWRNHAKNPALFGLMNVANHQHEENMPVHEGDLTWHDGALYATATGFDEGEPLREWTALDGDGIEIERAVGELYEPPQEAHTIIVEVGGHMVMQEQL
jgi:hypothetical protein